MNLHSTHNVDPVLPDRPSRLSSPALANNINIVMTIGSTSFIHFNDVYNVERFPFVASVKKSKASLEENHRQVFTFFSGDAFSPSTMSTILRGEQMLPVLNALDIDAVCLGNHDLDFGVAEFKDLKEQCNFPWICSNASERDETPLGGCHEYLILDKGSGSPRLLVLGLIETGWLDTLSTIDADDVIFEEPVDYVNRRIPELIEQYGPFDAVIAMSHMRMPMDYEVAQNGGVDIILGGHDHHYEDNVVNGIRVLNSATDFKSYTIVDVIGRDEFGKMDTTSNKVDITSDDESDPEIAEIVKAFEEDMNQGMNAVVGRSKVRLDARFLSIRTEETNVGNFLAEVVSRATSADVALIPAGSIRADRIFEPGVITARDVNDLLPKEDSVMVVKITGQQLLYALENGVSKYPAKEGRFPCVDGVRFTFDPTKPPGNRVVLGSVVVREKPLVPKRHTIIRGTKINMQYDDEVETDAEKREVEIGDFSETPTGYCPLDLCRFYDVASIEYLLKGKDGYDKAFDGAEVIHNEDSFPPLPTMIANLFTELRVMKRWSAMTVLGSTVISAASKFKRLARRSEADPFAIRPEVDGRITMLLKESVS